MTMGVENTQPATEVEKLRAVPRKHAVSSTSVFSHSNLFESIALAASVEEFFSSFIFQINTHTSTTTARMHRDIRLTRSFAYHAPQWISSIRLIYTICVYASILRIARLLGVVLIPMKVIMILSLSRVVHRIRTLHLVDCDCCTRNISYLPIRYLLHNFNFPLPCLTFFFILVRWSLYSADIFLASSYSCWGH